MRAIAFYSTLIPFIAFSNIVGTDAQNFNPTTNGLDFVTVQSSKTLPPCVFNCGLFANYAVNSFPSFKNNASQPNRTEVNDSLFSGDFNFGLGLSKNWDFGASFPYIFTQEVEDPTLVGVFDQSGVTEFRFNSKIRFYTGQSGGAAFVFSINIPRIENDPFIGIDGGPNYNFELAFDKRFQKINLAFNIGYRLRQEGTPIANLGIDPTPDQFIASFGLSFLMETLDTKLIWEVLSAFPVDDSGINSTDRDHSSLETILGIKKDFSSGLSLHFGGGTEIGHGGATPDWRVYSGLNWALGPICRKEKDNFIPKKKQARNRKNPKVVESFQSITLRGVNFEFGSEVITNESQTKLNDFIFQLKKIKKIKSILIEGHTDSMGDEYENESLGKNRAETIKDIIVRNTSIKPEQITALSFGETMPIADNGNFQGRYLNRRVEVKIFTDDDKVIKTVPTNMNEIQNEDIQMNEAKDDFEPSYEVIE
jgi:outer membrane protein OmpA-like peptidoglycan-associated protein